MSKSREDTLVEKLWKKNSRLYRELQAERKRSGYLARQLRKLKKGLNERKRNDDAPKQTDWEAGDV